MTKKQKILNVSFFVLTAGLLVYLSVALKKNDENRIEVIMLEGNSHLSKEQYFEFAHLLNGTDYKKLSQQILKDRFEKHPYVQRADVRNNGSGKVVVKLKEKIFESILSKNDNQYLLTDRLQVLPVMPRTNKIDYPIITNPALKDTVKVLGTLKKNNDVLTASKILSGIKLLNPELFDGLSSIDMRNGMDIVLSFSFLDYPVVVGRGGEIKKMVYFNNLWTYLRGKEINNYMEYVDLRYNGHVYFGVTQDTLQTGTKKS